MCRMAEMERNFLDEAAERYGGVIVVPLFDRMKHPTYKGWREAEPLDAAMRYVLEKRAEGRPVGLTGRFARLEGWGCVIDCEGRKWGARKTVESGLPMWVKAARAAGVAGMPSWVSPGGDGGLGIKNVLIPLPYAEVCDALGLEEAERRTGNSHRRKLPGGGELLLKWGVCIPVSFVGVVKVDWSWDVGSSSLDRLEAVARGMLDDLAAILVEAGVDESGEDGGDLDGEEPVVQDVLRALTFEGRDAGLIVTASCLEDGASRHYLCKTWANWAIMLFGERAGPGGGLGDGKMSDDEIGERIWSLWAREAGFGMSDVMKAVRDERRWLVKRSMV